MTADPLLSDMQRATCVAWIVTGVVGLLAGASLWFAFRAAARRTHMRLASAVVAIIVGVGVFAVLATLRYRIEERPFEPPVWIEPDVPSRHRDRARCWHRREVHPASGRALTHSCTGPEPRGAVTVRQQASRNESLTSGTRRPTTPLQLTRARAPLAPSAVLFPVRGPRS